ncbi:MAG TPA: pyruvate kinase alpha/beta domain-containing protein [Deltaproteobacteria bacterium]|nr:pyruvate kinase alpha/beta domain-containing protein [Deltaproteobacteria bacterium]HOM29382.1 pyruvate kinase alpha/beta domain-containing protein [Deltaproteobacteria bacterium]HPP81701.1 pyruvate kinase alpha/beta domain-containing protein [Deltaproteobacteria bacterium]
MKMREVKQMLFETPGKHNTDHCIDVVRRYVTERGQTHVVVASTTGRTALAFCRALKNSPARLVVVTHSVGFKEPNKDEFEPEARRILSQEGIPVHTGTILTHSLEKSLMDDFHGTYPGYIIATTLRRFGEGTKVAVEVIMEACDAGLIPEDEEVLGVGGTGYGADTVLLVRSKPSKRFGKLEVLEILARPRGR